MSATPLTDAVKTALRRSDLGIPEIARASGITHPTLYLFLNDRLSLTLRTLDKLAPVLGLKLVARGRRKGR